MQGRLIDAAKELIKSLDFDVNGILLPTGWQGGNGGLVSQDTLRKADALRRAVRAAEKEAEHGSGTGD